MWLEQLSYPYKIERKKGWYFLKAYPILVQKLRLAELFLLFTRSLIFLGANISVVVVEFHIAAAHVQLSYPYKIDRKKGWYFLKAYPILV